MSMPELFVCNGGGVWFTVHGRDEDGREYQIADLGDCGEFSTVLEPHEAAYYARLFAAAEKLKKALAELVACKDLKTEYKERVGTVAELSELEDEYIRREPEAWRRARDVLAELSETMQITIEYAPRCLWHSDCDAGKIKNNGVMGVVKECQERKATLLRCRKCGKAGYVPHGTPFDTPIRVPVVDIEETNDEH